MWRCFEFYTFHVSFLTALKYPLDDVMHHFVYYSCLSSCGFYLSICLLVDNFINSKLTAFCQIKSGTSWYQFLKRKKLHWFHQKKKYRNLMMRRQFHTSECHFEWLQLVNVNIFIVVLSLFIGVTIIVRWCRWCIKSQKPNAFVVLAEKRDNWKISREPTEQATGNTFKLCQKVTFTCDALLHSETWKKVNRNAFVISAHYYTHAHTHQLIIIINKNDSAKLAHCSACPVRSFIGIDSTKAAR